MRADRFRVIPGVALGLVLAAIGCSGAPSKDAPGVATDSGSGMSDSAGEGLESSESTALPPPGETGLGDGSSSSEEGGEVVEPPQMEAFFTRPLPDQPDTTLEDIVIELLERTPAGESIRAAYFTFTRSRMANAFVEAHARGVDVRLILGNTNDRNSNALTTLREGLGDRLTICREAASSGGCIGDGINHNKFIIFSALEDGSREVVLQSSANLTNPQTRQFNNLVVIRGDGALYEAYANYWSDLHAQVLDLGYYHSVVGDLPTKAYFFPRSSGDTIINVLNNVHCNIGADIYVAMAYFTNARVSVAQRLAQMDAEGCGIHVLTREGDNTGDVLATLSTGSVDLSLQPIMHSKYLVIDGAYGEYASHQKLVWTGSHNYTGRALRRNDEVLLRIRRDEVFEAFMDDWHHARSSAMTLHP